MSVFLEISIEPIKSVHSVCNLCFLDDNVEFSNKSNMPRNASQPSFTTHVSGLPKNGSVPFFDRIRKTSASERYRPTLQAIKNASRASMTSNGELRKSMHLKLSTASFGNNNCDDMWSNVSAFHPFGSYLNVRVDN